MEHIHNKFFQEYPGSGGGFSPHAGFMPEELLRQEGNTNYLYLIFNRSTKFTKIGISSDPDRRLRELTNAGGHELWLLFTIEFAEGCDISAKFMESYIHKYFAKQRIKGEWFCLSLRHLASLRELLWEVHGESIEDNFKELLTKFKHGKEQHT